MATNFDPSGLGFFAPLGTFPETEEDAARREAKERGLSKKGIQKRAKELEGSFLPTATLLETERDSLAIERTREVERINKLREKEGRFDYYPSGKGFVKLPFFTAPFRRFPREKFKTPAEIPESPTAFQLATQRATKDVVEELIASDLLTKRGKHRVSTVTRGLVRGTSFGIAGRRDLENPFTRAQLQVDPLSKKEKLTEGISEIAGSFIPYGVIAHAVGRSARTIGSLNRFATQHPFLFGATIQNFGEELVDMSIRRATGQEYDERHFVIGMALGGGFEGVFAGVRAFKNVDVDAVRAQINQISGNMKNPNTKALYDAIADQKISGTNITYKTAYQESRLLYFREKNGSFKNPVAETRLPGFKGDETLKAVKAANNPNRTATELEELMFEPSAKSDIIKVYRQATDGRYLGKFGDEGKEIVRLIDRADEMAGLNIGSDVIGMEPVLKNMNDVEFQRFPDIAEGKIAPQTDGEKALLEFWSGTRTDVAESAQRNGITVKDSSGVERPFVPREDFYPRILNDAAAKKIRSDPKKANKFYAKMVKESNGRIKNIAEAKKLFNGIIRDNIQKKFSHLERARELEFLPDSVLIKDPRIVLPRYLEGARRRLADAENFGPKQERLTGLIDQARVRGADDKTMADLVLRATGQEDFNETAIRASRFLRTYNNITKLGLVAITNVGDVVKPFQRTGEFIPTLRGLIKSFKADGIQQARRSGAVEANLKAMLSDAGDTTISDKFFKAIGFTWTETKIRTFSANAAIGHAEVLVERLKKRPHNAFAYRRLAQYIDNPDDVIKRGFLTKAEKDIVGFRGIADTQPLRRLDLPFYWQDPSVKITTQFKTFALKQMQFQRKFVLDEARQGNVRPLIAFLIMGQVVGEPVGDLKAWVRGRSRDQNLPRRIIDNYMTIGGLGLATDFLANIQYGSMGGGFLKFVAGPTFTDIDDWITRAMSPNRWERLSKKAIHSVPVIGPASSQKLFPSDRQYRARTIPIAEDILQLIEGSSNAPVGAGTSGRGRRARRTRRLPTRSLPRRRR